MAKSGGLLNSICARLTTTKVEQNGNNADNEVAMETEQSEDTDKENNNEPYVDNKEIKDVRMQDFEESLEIKPIYEKPEEQSSRRNRRKNMKPMNIAQLDNYEEEEEEQRHIDEDFSEFDGESENGDTAQNGNCGNDTENGDHQEDSVNGADDSESNENGEDILDLRSSSESVPVRNDDQVDENDDDNDIGVLDLSVTKNSDTKSENGYHGDEINANGNRLDLHDEDSLSQDHSEVGEHNSISNEKRDVPVDQAALKDYAQSTMSELLSMYGFEGEEVENITKNVPMHNFSSGKILERQRLQSEQAKSPRNRSHLKLAIDKKASAIAQASLPESPIPGSRSPLIGSRSPFIGSRSSSPLMTGSGASSPTNSMSSDAYSKLVESSSRLSSLPQGKSPSKFSLNLSSSSEGSPSKISASDYAQYMKRFFSYEQCKRDGCREMLLKEHYHCTDCNYKVFMKKEDMIRHFKWHKKRAESLQYGFMRYSPTDDCSERYQDCIHNKKQTHYHCLQRGCDKVYISTSDVQMHANFHRKDSAIIQEGFQRFRATEDCKTPNCAFYGQRTTHFHCRRQGCSFTFKNKADMEKHKAYHQKDEILGKDGFKKFMKYEHCTFIGCRYSKVSNHIHCIRPGCDYVLHSTGQLYSHKRKHERRDFEHAYRRFKTTDVKPRNILPAVTQQQQQFINAFAKNQQQKHLPSPAKPTAAMVLPTTPKQAIVTSSQNAEYIDLEDLPKMNKMDINFNNTSLMNATVTTTPSMTVEVNADQLDDEATTKPAKSTLEKLASKISGSALGDSLSLPIPSGKATNAELGPLELTTDDSKNGHSGIPSAIPRFVPKTSPPINEKKERDESWKRYLTRYTANDPCHPRCQFLYKDHYHCNIANCNMIFKSKDGVREHARYHDHQDRISSLSYKIVEAEKECPVDPKCGYSKNLLHYHCLWPDCGAIITANDPPFSRLEHHKIHEYARVACGKGVRPANPNSAQDHMKRRRGRPPKYPKNEIPVVPKDTMTDEEIQKALRNDKTGMQASLASGFKKYNQAEPCPDYNCVFYLKEHYHCVRPRCHHSTDRVDVLNLHAKDFHNYITLLEGFEYFDPRVDCRRPHCHNNRANKHFHCTRPRCDYSFVRYSTMAQHDKKHKLAEMSKELSSPQLALPKTLAELQQLGLTLPLTLPGSAAQVNAMQQLLQNAALQNLGAIRDKDGNIIKTKGTFYPIPSQNKGAGDLLSQKGSPGAHKPKITNSGLVNIAPKPNMPSEHGMALPLTMLLQQKATNTVPQMDWLTLCMRMHYGQMQNCGRPFCKLKKKDHYHCFDCSQAFSDPDRLKIHIAKHGVRLEKIGGSNTTTQDEQTSKMQVEETSNEGLDLTIKKLRQDENKKHEDQIQDDEIDPSSSLNLNPSTFSNLLNPNYLGKHNPQLATEDDESEEEGALVMDFSTQDNDDDDEDDEEDEEEDEEAGNRDDNFGQDDSQSLDLSIDQSNGNHKEEQSENKSNGSSEHKQESADVFDGTPTADTQVSFSRHSGRKRTAPKHDDFINSDILVTKQRRVSSSSTVDASPALKSPPKEAKEENLPEGYAKYRFTEDCGYERCAYRLTNTHYHCTRAECGFSFSDRSRLSQHQQRHDRYDTLMGDEFTQHRLHQSCERPDCELSKKSSHFHCQRCEFACTDSSKVLAHRKQHEKLDNIASLGFERVLSTSECTNLGCIYSMKQTHYHCLVEECKQGVLGPSMMQAHQQKHNASA